MQVKKQQLELDVEQQTGSKLGKEYVKFCILSPCLFNLYAEYIMQNARLDEAHAEIKIARRNINNLKYADDTTLMEESEELKSFLMKVKEESEKVGLKLNIQKIKIMVSGPITSQQIDRETMETVAVFIFEGLQNHYISWRRTWQPTPVFFPGESHGRRSLVGYNPWGCKEYQTRLSDFTFTFKITTDGDCSHEIKRCLVLGRKVMTNLDSLLKSRDVTLPAKVCLVKAMVFSVVMYGCESWTIKKAER